MIPTGVSMVVSGGAVSPENRSNERRPLEDLRATVDRANSLVSLKPFARDLIDLVAAVERERDSFRERFANQMIAAGELIAERDAALARIAAVEALCDEADQRALEQAGYDPETPLATVSVGDVRANLRAALAASPTPTGPEPAKCERDAVFDLCDCEVPGPATPEPTEETP